MKYNIIIAALPLLLLGIAGVGATNQVLAWNGDDWDHGCLWFIRLWWTRS